MQHTVILVLWGVVAFFAGYMEWGYWFPFVLSVLVSYLNRGWHQNNGCTEGRAIILGAIFALTACLPLYLIGHWVYHMPTG